MVDVSREVEREIAFHRFDPLEVTGTSHLLEFGERFVRAIDVGLVVARVMEFHDLLVDVRFERVVVVGKRW